jgi:hypothetical protein
MKKHLIAMILVSLLASPAAFAEGTYGGLSIGRVEMDEDLDAKTGNLGIVLGDINEKGIGYEFFYSLTVLDDSDKQGNDEVTAEIDTLGLFAVIQSPGDIYVKVKAGYGIVSLKYDIFVGDESGSINDSTEGFAYGMSVGAAIGDGAIELTYYKFADFDEFGPIEDVLDEAGFTDVSIDAEVEMINLSYIWTF